MCRRPVYSVCKNYVEALTTIKARDNVDKWKYAYNWYLIERDASPSKQEKIIKVSDEDTLSDGVASR